MEEPNKNEIAEIINAATKAIAGLCANRRRIPPRFVSKIYGIANIRISLNIIIKALRMLVAHEMNTTIRGT